MDLIAYPPEARVWIFQANDPVDEEFLPEIHDRIGEFTKVWTSHQKQLRATGSILHNRFIVLVVDQSMAGTSGCSIDKAMHFVQSLGHLYETDFLDRHYYTFVDNDQLRTVHSNELRSLYEVGEIDDDTPVYDNLVSTKEDFLEKWVVPLKDSWIKRVVFK